MAKKKKRLGNRRILKKIELNVAKEKESTNESTNKKSE